MLTVYRYRIRSGTGLLSRQAMAVNLVWNFCNESQKSCLRLGRKWLSGFDLDNLTAGTSTELGLRSRTINQVCHQYAKSRDQKRLPFLSWRGRKSLGWVPLRSSYIKIANGSAYYMGREFRLFYSRSIPDCAIIRDGSNFSEDAKGHWYLNLVLHIPDAAPREIKSAVGVDLGLRTLVALSTGERVENPRHFEKYAERLATAQRAHKKRRTVNVLSKIRNSRRDFHHKLSTEIIRRFDFVAVGNVSAAKLAKTRMAKSVLDAGWSSFRNMLRYKAIGHGAIFEEVNESFSTRVCSSCGSMAGPKGVADLGIRSWSCVECGTRHDRDQNAALNILAGSGYRALAEGGLCVQSQYQR